jgi:GNAT superfamily N-acetyltransferase
VPATLAPDPEQVAWCEAAEQAAFASILGAAPPALAAAIGLRQTRIAGALAIASRSLEKRMYNHVFALGVHAPVTAADLDALEAFFRGAGSVSARVALAPGAHVHGLAGALDARGFHAEDRWLRLWRDTAPVEAPGGSPRTRLAVRPLVRAEGEPFGRLLPAVFAHPEGVAPWFAKLAGLEDWHLFGAFDGGTLVACGALFVAGTTGWLGLGATLPTHRRHGAQSALIAARIDAAREAGITRLAVETADDTAEKPNPSTHNLRRLGFSDLYARTNRVKVLREPAHATP